MVVVVIGEEIIVVIEVIVEVKVEIVEVETNVMPLDLRRELIAVCPDRIFTA